MQNSPAQNLQTTEPALRAVGEASPAALLDPISQNIATVAELRARAEHEVDRHQRTAERITAWLGRPRFLYLLMFVMSAWVAVNVLAPHFHAAPFDPSPFNLLISVVNVGALLMATLVLITQNRQGKLAERREQLDLQINMLNDQRTAKIIALLEELRRDMPTVHNRTDPEADALSETINPKEVLAALETRLEEAMESAADMQAAAEEVEQEVESALHEAAALQRQGVGATFAPPKTPQQL